MKYAFMSFSCPEASLSEMLDLAKTYGYDGIEARAGSGHSHGIELDTTAEQREAIREQIARSGVELCCIAVSSRLASPDVEPHVEEARKAIDLAGDLGCGRVRVFGGDIGDTDRAHAISSLVGTLKRLAGPAGDRGVVLCLETHDAWCDPSHVAAVVEQADHPAVAVNWDIMHPVRKGGVTVTEAFEQLRPWIRHVHFHDGASTGEKLVFRPIGQGEIDHRTAVRLLKESGYDGFLSGEWIKWEPAETHLPRELETMRKYEAEV